MFVSRRFVLVALSIFESSAAYEFGKRQATLSLCPTQETITVTASECPIFSSSAPPSSASSSVAATYTSPSPVSSIESSTLESSFLGTLSSTESLVFSSFSSEPSLPSTSLVIPVTTLGPSSIITEGSTSIPAYTSSSAVISEPSSSAIQTSVESSAVVSEASTETFSAYVTPTVSNSISVSSVPVSSESTSVPELSTSILEPSSVIQSESSIFTSLTSAEPSTSIEFSSASSLISSTAASTTYTLLPSSSFVTSALPSSAATSTSIYTVTSSAPLPSISSITITTTVISTVGGQTTTVLSTFTQATTVATTVITTVQVPTTVVSLGTTTVIQYTTVSPPACTIHPTLTNGGFESGNGIEPFEAVATGPNAPSYTTAAVPHSGSNSLELLFFPSSSATSYITLTQTVSACPSYNYLLTGYVKASNNLSINHHPIATSIVIQTPTQSSLTTLINSSTYPGWSMIYLFFTAPGSVGDGVQSVPLTVHSYCDSGATDSPGLYVDDLVVSG
ncbi:uncharacterized protein EAF02_006255 [Botrytis sinoallii]|uniref:uncharacterized protein n=1 Tax=Botrytis sinoallii TaxID=1463999 RepID=UPI001901B032|nr:uncharacterized protein EAF02_006255 [Botrytis sinoallii]KAF7881567.1 hypothetical protein EAF02_006255 [Botrytis sinoallii]